jgi:hypothetical protein
MILHGITPYARELFSQAENRAVSRSVSHGRTAIETKKEILSFVPRTRL